MERRLLEAAPTMGILLIRDDDPNATTRPERLERAYAPLLDAGIPICFSVVPEVALDTRSPEGVRERFLDEGSEDCDRLVPLTTDTPLAGWLRRHESAVDVFVHGLTHRRFRGGTEFGALSYSEATVLGARALTLTARAIGRRPLGFVPPWDALSGGSAQALSSLFSFVSVVSIDRECSPIDTAPSSVRARGRDAVRLGNGWLVRHRYGRVTSETLPEEIPALLDGVMQSTEVGVIVLNHWMFWDRPEPHPVIVALARALRWRPTRTITQAIRYLNTVEPSLPLTLPRQAPVQIRDSLSA